MAWNALPDDLRDPSLSADKFPEVAKDASVSECTWTLSALEALRNALYKFKTYLLTYNDELVKCTAGFAYIVITFWDPKNQSLGVTPANPNRLRPNLAHMPSCLRTGQWTTAFRKFWAQST